MLSHWIFEAIVGTTCTTRGFCCFAMVLLCFVMVLGREINNFLEILPLLEGHLN